jgi:hypothetical protein
MVLKSRATVHPLPRVCGSFPQNDHGGSTESKFYGLPLMALWAMAPSQYLTRTIPPFKRQPISALRLQFSLGSFRLLWN